MFELIFTICLNNICTNELKKDGLLLSECTELMMSEDSGAGSLNCVPEYHKHWRPYSIDATQIDGDSNDK